MKNSRVLKIIISLLIVLFFCLLFILIFLMKDVASENNIDIVVSTGEQQTIEEIVEKSEAKMLKNKDNTIYLEFANDLYDEKRK